jgi:hypothetical protein
MVGWIFPFISFSQNRLANRYVMDQQGNTGFGQFYNERNMTKPLFRDIDVTLYDART